MKSSGLTQPDHFVHHVMTNGSVSNISSNEFWRKVAEIAEKLKSEKCGVTVSELILRKDKPDINKKKDEVKTYLKDL